MPCCEDGRVGFIDFGIVGRIPPEPELRSPNRSPKMCGLECSAARRSAARQAQDLVCSGGPGPVLCRQRCERDGQEPRCQKLGSRAREETNWARQQERRQRVDFCSPECVCVCVSVCLCVCVQRARKPCFQGSSLAGLRHSLSPFQQGAQRWYLCQRSYPPRGKQRLITYLRVPALTSAIGICNLVVHWLS